LLKNIIIPRFITKNIYLLVVAAWLITLSFLINNYWSSYSNLQSVQKKMKGYVHNTEKEFISLMEDSSFTGLAKDPHRNDLQQEKFSKKKYNLFLYNRDSSGSLELKYWNTQNVLPDSGIIYSALKAGFAQLPNGFYVWNKLDTAGILAIALIPIKWNYIVTNDYLKNDFIDNPLTGQPYDIFPGETKTGSIRSIHAIPLFYLVQKNNLGIVKDNVVSIWFRVLAALLILMFMHLCAEYIAAKNKLLHAGLFLAAGIIFLRALSYIFPVPLNLRQFELFDPTVYGSNFILRSLGDLLINTILFVWIIMFIRQQIQEKKISLSLKNPVHKWPVLIGGTFIILAATYTGVYIIRSLIADSQISFDVINFFTVNNIYSVLGFIVLCNIAVGYYFLCQLIVYLLKPLFSVLFIELYLCTAVLGLLLLSFKIGTLQEGLEIFSLAWLLLFLFLLNSSYLKVITTRIVSSKLVLSL
jgi:two-component system nitrogen regulation sensor histidine kinase NtrY